MAMVLRPNKLALLAAAAAALSLLSVPSHAFAPIGRRTAAPAPPSGIVELSAASSSQHDDERHIDGRIDADDLGRTTTHHNDAVAAGRRRFLTAGVTTVSAAAAAALTSNPRPVLAEDDATTESIAARAARLSKVIDAEEEVRGEQEMPSTPKPTTGAAVVDTRKIWDFKLPVAGVETSMTDLVRQEFGPDGEGTRVKAILVVNIKQDDVVARKNIPELIALASKYGRTGEFAVVCSPTDQGYYEPDTSQLLRLKLASEYGYGINPATIVTDKVNLLGTGAHPFWRWMQGTARTPEGLGRIRGNFEKFLVDGRTGRPVRRYPRRYEPKDIQDDIEALVAGRPLPPAGANWREQWRAAAKESEADTYRFQKGLNVFDQ